MTKRFLTLIFISAFMIAGTAFAQLTPGGKINGRVADDQGGPLPGVNVEATSPRLVGKAAAITDSNGVYRLMTLPSGTYATVFSLPGFKTLVRKGIVLELSQTLNLNVSLDPAALDEQLTVIG